MFWDGKYKVLILTDHSNHSAANSVYAIASALAAHPIIGQVDLATRGAVENNSFFLDLESDILFVSQVKNKIEFSPDASCFKVNIREVKINEYDLILLRLPPPLEKSFLDFLVKKTPNVFILNNPVGIYETGSKAFLMNFKDVCAPMKLCTSIDDIATYRQKFPIVLKPYREYGGKGIVKIEGDYVYDGNKQIFFNEFIDHLDPLAIEYLAVKFLKNVTLGDKRIIVVNGKVLGASLRLPASGSWMCNVAMGGSTQLSDISADEFEIVERVNPILSRMGIVMYGLDTLVDDSGKRILSEINTTSIGGIPQLAQQKKLPIVDETVELILAYFIKHR